MLMFMTASCLLDPGKPADVIVNVGRHFILALERIAVAVIVGHGESWMSWNEKNTVSARNEKRR